MYPIHEEINLAANRLRYLSPRSIQTPSEIALLEPKKEHYSQKIDEIESFLEAHPEIAERFNTIEDGCGIASVKYLESAKARLARMK